MPSFLAELKRRRVVRVALVYGAVAFAVVQAADVFVPALALPEWILTAVALLAILGFPVAVVLAWEELKKRKIVQRALAYLAGAWVALQLLDVVAEPWGIGAGLLLAALLVVAGTAVAFERVVDVIDVQADVAEQVADQLAATFTERDRRRMVAGATDDPIAYDLYLEAREQPGRTRVEFERRLDLYRQAVRADSTFARAWTELGLAFRSGQIRFGYEAWSDSSRAVLDRASKFAADSALIASLERIRALLSGDRQRYFSRLRSFARANPSDVEAAASLANTYLALGDLPEAVEWRRHATGAGLRPRPRTPAPDGRRAPDCWRHDRRSRMARGGRRHRVSGPEDAEGRAHARAPPGPPPLPGARGAHRDSPGPGAPPDRG